MSLLTILLTCTTLAALLPPATPSPTSVFTSTAPGHPAPSAASLGPAAPPASGRSVAAGSLVSPPRPLFSAPAPSQGGPSGPSGHWRWPLGPPAPKVLRLFSPPPSPWGAGHRGVDLAARPGEPVYASAAGHVSYAGRLAGQGIVAVTHGALRTTYLPVRPAVRRGRQVNPGTRIGTVEATWPHCPTTCLHWGLIHGSVYLDPLRLVRPKVRLLPYWEPRPQPKPSPPTRTTASPGMDLRDATTAGGGALVGMLLAFLLSLAWRHGRSRSSTRRPPPGVIDLTRERRQRRAR
ncbi:peptidoglycan DD-metalloendopeptidase family protein [Actinomadura sp. NPDC047616]|uniref:murein hydrolase activator EnvC family protein n=1 Tax=Actinomadura sp. NPDC047616 TaxID=3155914 RepID=UPI0033D2C08B